MVIRLNKDRREYLTRRVSEKINKNKGVRGSVEEDHDFEDNRIN